MRRKRGIIKDRKAMESGRRKDGAKEKAKAKEDKNRPGTKM